MQNQIHVHMCCVISSWENNNSICFGVVFCMLPENHLDNLLSHGWFDYQQSFFFTQIEILYNFRTFTTKPNGHLQQDAPSPKNQLAVNQKEKLHKARPKKSSLQLAGRRVPFICKKLIQPTRMICSDIRLHHT